MTTVTVTRWVLENKQDTHYKFYATYACSSGDVIFHWGRIGTDGQSQFHHVTHGVDEVASKKAYQKAGNRGYSFVEQGFRFEIEENTLLAAIKAQDPTVLARAASKAKNKGVTDAQEGMVAEYEQLIDRMNGFLARLQTGSFLDVLDEFQAIDTTWKQVVDAHEMAATTLDLTKRKLMEAL